MTFAGFSGDFNPMHVNHEYAATTPFRRPIAHGFGIFSIASGLGVMIPPVRTVALLAVVHWRFLHPVFVGDTITVRTRVNQKTVRGRGRRGEVVWYKGDPQSRWEDCPGGGNPHAGRVPADHPADRERVGDPDHGRRPHRQQRVDLISGLSEPEA